MPIEKIIIQIVIILLISQEFFRKSPAFNFAYEQTFSFVSKLINWRANADNIRELINIPKLSIQVSVISLLIFFLLSFIAVPPFEILIVLFSVFVGGLILNSLFEWVLNHRETIKVFIPAIKIYIFVVVLIMLNFLLNTDYPKNLEIFKIDYNIHIPSKTDLIEQLLIFTVGLLVISYLGIWVFSLSVIFIILIVLTFTTFISKFIKRYLGRGGLGVIIIITQVWIFWN